MSEYSLLLQDYRWKELRDKILKRDAFICGRCFKGNCQLNVHVIQYLPNTKPWDIPSHLLISLCNGCHFSQTNKRTIRSIKREYKPSLNPRLKKPRVKKVWIEGKGLVEVSSKEW